MLEWDVSSALLDLIKEDNFIFLSLEPEINDFRQLYTGNIYLHGSKQTISIPAITPIMLAGFLNVLLDNASVLGWDIKKLYSYLRYHFRTPNAMLDLKLAEAFKGIYLPCPKTWSEAKSRWDATDKKIHQSIHVPLATKVIPILETTGWIDDVNKKLVYSSYEIEGQTHGRLSCHKSFDDCIIPHTLSPEDKQKYKLQDEKKFVLVDYKHMEVSVLQWLSGDKKLGAMIKSGKDLYSILFHYLFGKPGDRQLIKDSFLPIVYGIREEALSQRLNIDKEKALWMIKEIEKAFPEAMNWAYEHQENAKKGPVADYFGRTRTHEKPWVARNAVVQGPGAIVCLEKLIQVCDYDVVASIHDAYLFGIHQRELDWTIPKIVDILQEPSQMCPGLTLKVECKVGDRLSDMKGFK